MCRVALGRSLYVPTKDVDPRACEDGIFRGPCHSVLGDRIACRGTFREFVARRGFLPLFNGMPPEPSFLTPPPSLFRERQVFDDDAVYPAFILKYKRVFK